MFQLKVLELPPLKNNSAQKARGMARKSLRRSCCSLAGRVEGNQEFLGIFTFNEEAMKPLEFPALF
jgi:hypothetical protein